MLELKNIAVAGMHCDGDLLWLAAPEQRLVATYHPASGKTEKRLVYPQEVWDVCPGEGAFWMVTAGGKLGRQIVCWSLEKGEEARRFSCPDGAAAGMTLLDGKLWLTHRHNRKLFCLDPASGKINWVIRMEHETFSPAAYKSDLWFIESDPGPLGHWSEARQGRYFFSRYDPARERVVERVAVPFVPRCMAFDGERFWYAEGGKKGLASAKKNFR
jgi:hypothetical protein